MNNKQVTSGTNIITLTRVNVLMALALCWYALVGYSIIVGVHAADAETGAEVATQAPTLGFQDWDCRHTAGEFKFDEEQVDFLEWIAAIDS